MELTLITSDRLLQESIFFIIAAFKFCEVKISELCLKFLFTVKEPSSILLSCGLKIKPHTCTVISPESSESFGQKPRRVKQARRKEFSFPSTPWIMFDSCEARLWNANRSCRKWQNKERESSGGFLCSRRISWNDLCLKAPPQAAATHFLSIPGEHSQLRSNLWNFQ